MREIAEMVAGIRMDEVESKMAHNPEEYPEYTDGIEAERIITQELIEKYSLDDLSVRFHLSKGKLNQLFHQQMEMSTMDYVTKRRISYAQQLLLNGIPAAQAGSAAGFGDYAGFYRAYKKTLGHSPSDDHRSVSGNSMMQTLYQETSSPGPVVADDSLSNTNIWDVNRSTRASEIDISVLRDQ